MCGFSGILSKNTSGFKNLVEKSTKIINHRGPDDTDFYFDDNFAVGFNRLKIIDLSSAANQPFKDEDFVLVFNGEIYNYVELQNEFKFNLKTKSDTEVLFSVLKKFRNDIGSGLNLLNGMFALAFYDKKAKRLILARDRFGVKPLHYCFVDGAVVFSSEIKALKNYTNNFKVNHKAVINFLVNRSLDYTEETFFDGISQVGQSSFLEFGLGEKGAEKTVEKKYWNLSVIKSRDYRDENKVCEEFRKLFLNAVSIRLRSDVPLAALLSGGLDSSAIVAAVASPDALNNKIKTFSAVYPGDPLDERKFAETLTEQYKNINPVWIEIKTENFFKSLEKVIYHQETPIADGSMVAHFLLMEKINENGIKVVLTGQGGDEILGGYVHTFLPAYEADRIRNFNFKNFSLRAFFHSFPAFIKNIFRAIYVFRNYGKFFAEKGKLKLVDDFYVHFKNKTILNSYLLNSLFYWSLPGFLHYDDRNSMAFAIETRGPFLDYRLAEFMISLPNEFKIRDNKGKWLLRESLKDLIPHQILDRKDKQGFYAPIDRWSENIPVDFLIDEEFKHEFDYLNLQEVQKDKTMKWRVFTLWLWYKKYIKID
ncbi:MAG: asparagine synthase (glutamine-hydrolyzing) [Candidatus Paceibacterota bacterium]